MLLEGKTGHFRTGRTLNLENNWIQYSSSKITADNLKVVFNLTDQVIENYKQVHKFSRVDTLEVLEDLCISLFYDRIPISLSKDRKISANKLKRLATNVEILYPKIFRYKSGFTSYKAQSKPPVLTLSVDAQDVHEHALHHKKHTGRDLDLSRYDPLYYKQLLDKEEL